MSEPITEGKVRKGSVNAQDRTPRPDAPPPQAPPSMAVADADDAIRMAVAAERTRLLAMQPCGHPYACLVPTASQNPGSSVCGACLHEKDAVAKAVEGIKTLSAAAAERSAHEARESTRNEQEEKWGAVLEEQVIVARIAEAKACAAAVCDGCRDGTIYDPKERMHGIRIRVPCRAAAIRERIPAEPVRDTQAETDEKLGWLHRVTGAPLTLCKECLLAARGELEVAREMVKARAQK